MTYEKKNENASQIDLALIERPVDAGLYPAEISALADSIGEREMIPVEFENPGSESTAMGFISLAFAEDLDYDYKGIEGFVGGILADMNKETVAGKYEYKGWLITIER